MFLIYFAFFVSQKLAILVYGVKILQIYKFILSYDVTFKYSKKSPLFSAFLLATKWLGGNIHIHMN